MPDLSPAETLTSAAQKLQHSAEHGDLWVLGSASQKALADWLVMEADRGYPTSSALAVARALLSGAS
jgi:hypothetical protein